MRGWQLGAWEWSEYLSPHTRGTSNASRVLYQTYKAWHSDHANTYASAKHDDVPPPWSKRPDGSGVVGSAGTDLEHIMGAPGPVRNGWTVTRRSRAISMCHRHRSTRRTSTAPASRFGLGSWSAINCCSRVFTVIQQTHALVYTSIITGQIVA